MIKGQHAPNVFKEFLDPFHQIDQDPEEQRMEGMGSYYFMAFTVWYMPECVVYIFDAVRFQLFKVRIVIVVVYLVCGQVSYGVSGGSPNPSGGAMQSGQRLQVMPWIMTFSM